MNPNDILLINIPPYNLDNIKHDYMGAQYVFPPMGPIILAERLKKLSSARKVKCMDYAMADYTGLADSDFKLFIEKELKSFIRINDLNPMLIGVSIMFSSTYEFFSEVVAAVRRCFPNVTIVAGGIHATNAAGYILEHDAVDYVSCGEGESAIVLLANSLAQGLKPQAPGLYSKDNLPPDGNFEIAPYTEDLDIDFTVYPEIVDMDGYVNRTSLFSLSTHSIQNKAFPIMASRGCPVGCIFCAAHTVHGRKARWRSLSNVRDEMLWLYKQYGVTKFYLMDDNFIPKAKALALFEMLSEIPIPDIDVVIQNMSINHTDHEIIDAVAKAKINYLPLAIETGSPEMQKKIKKFCNLDKAVDLVAYARAKGLNTRCFYIIGFPGETVEQMEQTIEFSLKVKADWSSFNVAVPLPGSEMFGQFEELGYIRNSPPFWKASTIRDRVFDTKEITAHDIKNLAYMANLKVNFLNNVTIQEGKYQEAEMIFQNFLVSYDFHIFGLDALRRIYMLTGRAQEAEKVVHRIKELLKTNEKSKEFLQWKSLFPSETQALYF